MSHHHIRGYVEETNITALAAGIRLVNSFYLGHYKLYKHMHIIGLSNTILCRLCELEKENMTSWHRGGFSYLEWTGLLIQGNEQT